eukprot:1142576-Pelagomonas_calceolata.AAC.3
MNKTPAALLGCASIVDALAEISEEGWQRRTLLVGGKSKGQAILMGFAEPANVGVGSHHDGCGVTP